MPWIDLTKSSSSFLTEGQGWFHFGWFYGWFGSGITSDFSEISKKTSDWDEITKL